MINEVQMQENTERLKLKDFYICPYILHVDANTDAWSIASDIKSIFSYKFIHDYTIKI